MQNVFNGTEKSLYDHHSLLLKENLIFQNSYGKDYLFVKLIFDGVAARDSKRF